MVKKEKKKNPPSNAGDAGSVPRSGRTAGGGNANPLQDSCLENSMDTGAWWATQSMASQHVEHDQATEHTHTHKDELVSPTSTGKIIKVMT